MLSNDPNLNSAVHRMRRVALERAMCAQWSRLSPKDALLIRSRADLSAKLQATYGMGPAQTGRLLEEWARGRTF